MSEAEYVGWLHGFAANLQMSADELYSAYRAGQVQETDEVWLWAEMWRDHTEHLAAEGKRFGTTTIAPDMDKEAGE